jgi:hypothetical protein
MYKKGVIFNKTLVIGIIIFIIVTSSFQNIEANSIASVSLDDDGNLLGYVNDTSGNPIEGALVRVYFHETYREDYSNSDGYYHVTNISICWCMKNVSCSKEGYKTEWVMLSIAENTTYDFVLTSGNQPPSAPLVDGPSVGRPGEEYCITFRSIDPDGNDVFYYIDWGDGEYEDWFGPFDPGENVTRCHTYPPATKLYEIRVGVKDIYGAEGDWGSIYVFILKGRMQDNSFFIRFLERFPMFQRLLSLFL